MDKELKDRLIELFKSQPYAKQSLDGRHIMFRCPFCGDSIKSASSINFSVLIDNDPMLYKCFRSECNASGIVDIDFINRLGCNNYNIILGLNKYLRTYKSHIGSKSLFKMKHKKELSNVMNTDNNELNQIKLKYINKRLGQNLSYIDLYKLKINLDVNYLLHFNNIPIDFKHKKLYDKYSSWGIGFISAYNDYVIIRELVKGKLPHRYNNLNIYNNYDNVTKFYTIPSSIDVLSPETTILNVTEGSFDILGVYYNTNIDRKYKNQIFAAASGAGINNLICHYIREYGLTNLKINIFSDADVNIDKYKILYKLKPLLDNFNITIYYNTKEKDFGVPKNKIEYISSKL